MAGRLTPVLNRIIPRATDPEWKAMDDMADTFGLPRQWIVCPMCGQQSWRLPPHGFDPCPIVAAVAEATGLKADAERSTALRLGVHMEETTKALRQMMDDEEEDE